MNFWSYAKTHKIIFSIVACLIAVCAFGMASSVHASPLIKSKSSPKGISHPTFLGVVSAVGPSTITLEVADGQSNTTNTVTIVTNSATRILHGKTKNLSIASLLDATVRVTNTLKTNGIIIAQVILIIAPAQ